MKKEVSKFRKVTMNIPTKLYQELEKRCEDNGTTTTAEILSLVRFGLKQEQAIEMLPTIIDAINEKKPTKKVKK